MRSFYSGRLQDAPASKACAQKQMLSVLKKGQQPRSGVKLKQEVTSHEPTQV